MDRGIPKEFLDAPAAGPIIAGILAPSWRVTFTDGLLESRGQGIQKESWMHLLQVPSLLESQRHPGKLQLLMDSWNTEVKESRMDLGCTCCMSHHCWNLSAILILRRIFGSIFDHDEKRWMIWTNEELHGLNKEPDIVTFIKKGRLRWIGHVERMDATCPLEAALDGSLKSKLMSDCSAFDGGQGCMVPPSSPTSKYSLTTKSYFSGTLSTGSSLLSNFQVQSNHEELLLWNFVHRFLPPLQIPSTVHSKTKPEFPDNHTNTFPEFNCVPTIKISPFKFQGFTHYSELNQSKIHISV
ncbi:hypothetical protein GE061_004104 [Apolygus lucorum]|uniref:Uncharacterized protein n=1 Tax=Apolygus lucorum TaxID=248454 RepID=A0A8S9WZR3_APOLU|nr:hypothetical protein GE061_004104 [Apolygus lucorum]